MKNQTIMMLFTAFTLVFASCEKTDVATDTAVQPTSDQNDAALHALAKLLVEDRATGGEFAQKQVERYGQTGVEEFLLAEFVETGIGLRSPSAVQQLLAQNPLMEIAYPSYSFFKDTETLAQHISNIQYYVVIGDGVDPEYEEVEYLPVYTPNGSLTQLPNVFNESVRYAVVAMDEAHDAFVGDSNTSVKGVAKPNSLDNFTPANVVGNVRYYEEATISNAQVVDAGPVEFGPITFRGGNGPESGCDRPANKKDQLYKIRFSNKAAVKVIESGFRLPKVELKITYGVAAVASNGTVSLGQFFTQVNKHWEDMTSSSWSNVSALNQQIKTWLPTDADTWAELFVEDDGGSSASFTFGVTPKYTVDKKWEFATPVSFTVPVKNNDDIAGNVIIEYCDPAEGEGTFYKVYSGGNDGMYFRQNFQQQ